MKKQCKNCEWFRSDPNDGYAPKEIGSCERYPPQYIQHVFDDNMKSLKTFFKGVPYDLNDASFYFAHKYPRVNIYRRCGEWKKKEPR